MIGLIVANTVKFEPQNKYIIGRKNSIWKTCNTGIDVFIVGFGGWKIGGSTEGFTSYGDTNQETSLNALLEHLIEE